MPTFPKNKGFGSKKKDERLGSKPTMMPGGNSDINPGIFAGKEVKKYQAMKAHPMRYEPMNAVDGKSHADLKAAGGKAFDIHMRDHSKGVFPENFGPMRYEGPNMADEPMFFGGGMPSEDYKAKSNVFTEKAEEADKKSEKASADRSEAQSKLDSARNTRRKNRQAKRDAKKAARKSRRADRIIARQ